MTQEFHNEILPLFTYSKSPNTLVKLLKIQGHFLAQPGLVNQIFSVSFLTLSLVKYGIFFNFVLLKHISKKKVLKSHPQKSKILGVAKNGTISAD